MSLDRKWGAYFTNYNDMRLGEIAIKPINLTKVEHNDIRWFHLNDISCEKLYPHMRRFIEKLKGNL